MDQGTASGARQGNRDAAVPGTAVAAWPHCRPDPDTGQHNHKYGGDQGDAALVAGGRLLGSRLAGKWHYAKYR